MRGRMYGSSDRNRLRTRACPGCKAGRSSSITAKSTSRTIPCGYCFITIRTLRSVMSASAMRKQRFGVAVHVGVERVVLDRQFEHAAHGRVDTAERIGRCEDEAVRHE